MAQFDHLLYPYKTFERNLSPMNWFHRRRRRSKVFQNRSFKSNKILFGFSFSLICCYWWWIAYNLILITLIYADRFECWIWNVRCRLNCSGASNRNSFFLFTFYENCYADLKFWISLECTGINVYNCPLQVHRHSIGAMRRFFANNWHTTCEQSWTALVFALYKHWKLYHRIKPHRTIDLYLDNFWIRS